MNAFFPARATLNYQPCRYGNSRLAFRGPAKRLRGGFFAFLGGSETFGAFIETPFPELAEQATGVTCVNLGCLHAGIDAYLHSPGLLDICTMARATVVQVMGAQNMSNRFFSVDPRRNDRFLRASKRLKSLYPDVGFSGIETTNQLLSLLARTGPDRLPRVRQEMQDAWVARMRGLISDIDTPVVLLWAADHPPYTARDGGTICREPLFVDRAMLKAVAGTAAQLVEVVVTPAQVAAGYRRMVIGPGESAAAIAMLGPVAHCQIADALAGVLPAFGSAG